MQTIDRKLLDLILEAGRLRGNPASRWEVCKQEDELNSKIGRDLNSVGSEPAIPVTVALEPHIL